MKPLIGLLTEVNDECTSIALSSYPLAIESAGGVPMVIPYTESAEAVNEYMRICDGFFFTGGADVSPSIYGDADPLGLCQAIQRKRDEHELRFLRAALAEGKPILAVCRGMQLLNAALGGTLYKDIPTEIPSRISHRQSEPKNMPSHSVSTVKGTPLHTLLGKESVGANSFHHQGVKALGEGLLPMAYAEDGMIEAVYSGAGGYIRGYQWHPERLFETDEDNMLIFVDFVNACK